MRTIEVGVFLVEAAPHHMDGARRPTVVVEVKAARARPGDEPGLMGGRLQDADEAALLPTLDR